MCNFQINFPKYSPAISSYSAPVPRILPVPPSPACALGHQVYLEFEPHVNSFPCSSPECPQSRTAVLHSQQLVAVKAVRKSLIEKGSNWTATCTKGLESSMIPGIDSANSLEKSYLMVFLSHNCLDEFSYFQPHVLNWLWGPKNFVSVGSNIAAHINPEIT